MGKCRTERLGDGNRSCPPDPALQSGWGHFSPGYGGGLTGHWAAQWMDICITLAGLFDGSMFWINNGDSWSKKLEGRFFFLIFNFIDKSRVMCNGSYLIGAKHKFWISMLKINKQKPQFNRLGRPAGGALRTCKPDSTAGRRMSPLPSPQGPSQWKAVDSSWIRACPTSSSPL